MPPEFGFSFFLFCFFFFFLAPKSPLALLLGNSQGVKQNRLLYKMDHLEQHALHVGEKNYVRMCYLVIYKEHCIFDHSDDQISDFSYILGFSLMVPDLTAPKTSGLS